jgi:hypothetical protein
MLELAIQWKDFLNPEFYIQHGGLWLFLFIVFAETGLFAGFFLPGDSLLFVAGIYSNELAGELFDLNNDVLNLLLVCLLVFCSGTLGLPAVLICSEKTIPFFSRKNICSLPRISMTSMVEAPLYLQDSFPSSEPLLPSSQALFGWRNTNSLFITLLVVSHGCSS